MTNAFDTFLEDFAAKNGLPDAKEAFDALAAGKDWEIGPRMDIYPEIQRVMRAETFNFGELRDLLLTQRKDRSVFMLRSRVAPTQIRDFLAEPDAEALFTEIAHVGSPPDAAQLDAFMARMTSLPNDLAAMLLSTLFAAKFPDRFTEYRWVRCSRFVKLFGLVPEKPAIKNSYGAKIVWAAESARDFLNRYVQPLNAELANPMWFVSGLTVLINRSQTNPRPTGAAGPSLLQPAVNPEGSRPASAPENKILYGPPGTGKTHATRDLAYYLCGADDDFAYQEGQIEFITFHQSYSYEEFVEGIRPVLATSSAGSQQSVQYRLVDGVFKRLALLALSEGLPDVYHDLDADVRIAEAKTALDNWQTLKSLNFDRDDIKQFVLVIDEINRGNISRILGELITLLEPSKRLGCDDQVIVTLPYSGERFAVPPNLHVIGTMNTADRSIALMDIALRRRFQFEEMMPDADVLVAHLTGTSDAAWAKTVTQIMTTINERICLLYDRDHQIGHSFFMKADSPRALRDIFKYEIIPLLQEYFHNAWERIAIVLGCPYENGKLKRAHAFPLLRCASSEPRDVLGYAPEFVEEQHHTYSVNQQFLDTADEHTLRRFFNGILGSPAPESAAGNPDGAPSTDEKTSEPAL